MEGEVAAELVEGASPAVEPSDGRFPAPITILEEGVGLSISVSVVDADTDTEAAANETESNPASWASAMMDAIASASIEVEGGGTVETLVAVGVATIVDEEVILTSWGSNGPEYADEDATAIELDERFDTGEDDATDVDPTIAAESVAEGTTIEAVVIRFEVIGAMDELDLTSAAETGVGAVVEAIGASVAVVDTTGSDRTGGTEVRSVEVDPVVTAPAVSEDTAELD
jgi:hypothetical protein